MEAGSVIGGIWNHMQARVVGMVPSGSRTGLTTAVTDRQDEERHDRSLPNARPKLLPLWNDMPITIQRFIVMVVST